MQKISKYLIGPSFIGTVIFLTSFIFTKYESIRIGGYKPLDTINNCFLLLILISLIILIISIRNVIKK